MKKILLLLLLIPTSLFSQTNNEISHFYQRDYVFIGKLSREYAMSGKLEVSMEYVTDLNTNVQTKLIYLNQTSDGTSLELDAMDIDSAIAAINTIIEKIKMHPANKMDMLFQCSNGFELKISYDGSHWSEICDNYTSLHNNSIPLYEKDLPELVSILKQAKNFK